MVFKNINHFPEILTKFAFIIIFVWFICWTILSVGFPKDIIICRCGIVNLIEAAACPNQQDNNGCIEQRKLMEIM